MAYVTSLDESPPPERGRPRRECNAGWFVTSHRGERVLQVDTYGSQTRQDVGTVSQSLQLDEVRAEQLVRMIFEAFPAGARPTEWQAPLLINGSNTSRSRGGVAEHGSAALSEPDPARPRNRTR